MKKASLLLSFAALCVLCFIGCAGYQLGNIPRADMKEVHTIYVPVVKNNSYEPGLPVMVTNAILRRIDNDGTYSSSRSAAAASEGTIPSTSSVCTSRPSLYP